MPTFIDESGDTGPISTGGSVRFILTAVWLPNQDNVEIFRQKIIELRQSLGLSEVYEFKYSKRMLSTHGGPPF
jgi:hypothetical protein